LKDLATQHFVTYQNDMQHSYMVIEMAPEDKVIDYQIRVINENPAAQLLTLHKRQVDDKIYLFYDITSKITLDQLLKRKKFNKHEFLSLIKSLITALKLKNIYLLRGGSFILNSEHLYVNPSTLEVSLAYLPVEKCQEINQALKDLLMDLIVYKATFASALEGDFVYQLLSLLKKEDFNIVELDRLIGHLAVNHSSKQGDALHKEPIKSMNSRNAFGSSQQKETLLSNRAMLLGLVQVFFIAIGILLFRYLQSKGISLDAAQAVGLVFIVAAVDILTVKKFKLAGANEKTLKQKNADTQKSKAARNRIPMRRKPLLETQKHEFGATQTSREHQGMREFDTRVLICEEASLPYLLAVGEGTHERICINKPSFIVGRVRSQADYISGNNAVGKLHAEISVKDNTYYIRDLNSRNGTYINGERIVSNVEHIIQNNDRISFANSEYKFFQGERADKPK